MVCIQPLSGSTPSSRPDDPPIVGSIGHDAYRQLDPSPLSIECQYRFLNSPSWRDDALDIPDRRVALRQPGSGLANQALEATAPFHPAAHRVMKLGLARERPR